ncbi:phage head spike fiber domain-containing protein [Acinetobacter baumannii]
MSLTITVPNTNFENFVDIVSPITFDFSKESLVNTSDTSLIDKLSFTRNSIATVCNKNGVLETVAANVPRYNYDPITKQFRGILLEGPSTNMLTYSESFNNWTFLEASKGSTTISPDNTNNCFKIVGNTQNTEHSFSRNIGQQVDGRLIYSAFLKKGDYDHVALSIEGFSVPMELIYKFSTKSIVSKTNAVVWFEVIDAPNGFVRLFFRGYATNPVGNTIAKVSLVDDNLNKVFVGDTSKGTYVWGTQFENINYSPSSYIPTGATPVARESDDCIASIPSMAGKTIGLITEFEKPVLQLDILDAYRFIPIVGLRRTGNISNYNKAICVDRASKSVCAVTVPAATEVVANSGVSITSGKIKACAMFSSTDESISCNGSVTATQIENTMPANLTLLRLGPYLSMLPARSDYAGVNIKNLRLFFVNLPKGDLSKISKL